MITKVMQKMLPRSCTDGYQGYAENVTKVVQRLPRRTEVTKVMQKGYQGYVKRLPRSCKEGYQGRAENVTKVMQKRYQGHGENVTKVVQRKLTRSCRER